MKVFGFLIFMVSAQICRGDNTAFYACKSTVEYSAMLLVDQGMDILSPRSAPYPDQSQFQLSEGQVRVRIVVEEDQAGYHIFGATVAYQRELVDSGISYNCQVTDLKAL